GGSSAISNLHTPKELFKEYNPQFKTKDQRRKFLKDLANQLCMPSIEARSTNQLLMRNHFLKGAVQMVLGGRRVTPPIAQVPHGSRGPSPIVGICYVCRDQKRKQLEVLQKLLWKDELELGDTGSEDELSGFCTTSSMLDTSAFSC
ncbi:hypothetical protein CBL_02859, partial [Carabus blaptoides fortunei]